MRSKFTQVFLGLWLVSLAGLASGGCSDSNNGQTFPPGNAAGGNNNNGGAPAVNGLALHGPGIGGTVTVLTVDNVTGVEGSTLVSGITDSNGNFSLPFTGTAPTNQIIRVRISGGTYVSEADGTTVTVQSPMTALLTPADFSAVLAGREDVLITPVSTLADTLAVAGLNLGASEASRHSLIFFNDLLSSLTTSGTGSEDQVKLYLGILKATPLSTLVKNGTVASLGLAGETQLAVALTALDQLDKTISTELGVPRDSLTSALVSDAADGSLDGLTIGGLAVQVGGKTLPPTTFSIDLITALNKINTPTFAAAIGISQATLSAAIGNISTGVATAPVVSFKLANFQLSPATSSIAVNATQQFGVVGNFTNGTTSQQSAIPSSSLTWTSSALSIASVSSTGLATGLSAGVSTISGFFTMPGSTQALTAQAQLTITGGSTGGGNTTLGIVYLCNDAANSIDIVHFNPIGGALLDTQASTEASTGSDTPISIMIDRVNKKYMLVCTSPGNNQVHSYLIEPNGELNPGTINRFALSNLIQSKGSPNLVYGALAGSSSTTLQSYTVDSSRGAMMLASNLLEVDNSGQLGDIGNLVVGTTEMLYTSTISNQTGGSTIWVVNSTTAPPAATPNSPYSSDGSAIYLTLGAQGNATLFALTAGNLGWTLDTFHVNSDLTAERFISWKSGRLKVGTFWLWVDSRMPGVLSRTPGSKEAAT